MNVLSGFLSSSSPEGGIWVVTLNAGQLTARPAAVGVAASYLVLAADGRTLYAVGETEDGTVSAFVVNGESLRLLNTRSTGGANPCHLAVVRGHVLSANYVSGSICVHRLQSDGAIGERTDLVEHASIEPPHSRQEGPHAHMVAQHPPTGLVFSTDLGTDTVYRYRLDVDSGRLDTEDSVRMVPGSGPRHLAFHPSGEYAYVVGELDSTVTVLRVAGDIVAGQVVSTLPADSAVENYPSGIQVSADGRFCYVANRGHDSIAVLQVVHQDGDLRLVGTVPCGGQDPRDLVLAGDCLLVMNLSSDMVSQFRIDLASGLPQPSGQPLAIPAPACIAFAAAQPLGKARVMSQTAPRGRR